MKSFNRLICLLGFLIVASSTNAAKSNNLSSLELLLLDDPPEVPLITAELVSDISSSPRIGFLSYWVSPVVANGIIYFVAVDGVIGSE
nr:hypothetical protein [Acidiferrobacterales bacterium]